MSRTIDRARSSFYRAAGLPRVATMIAMLVVIGMLIFRAADPNSWAWLTREGEAPAEPDSPVPTAPRREPPHSAEIVSPGPTDTDLEERGAAAEQFQALSDRTTKLGREEMPAYWRLFGWAEHQSLAELDRRADRTAVLDQFLQNADDQRGKLFQLELNVRRVLSYDAPENSAGIKKVYEIWGWTTESKAWLYCVLTAHLPPGMPVGPDVSERVTFAGYFLKIQGYHAAGAGPRDKPLDAPLLIGRVDWHQPPKAASAGGEPSWVLWLSIVGLFVVASVVAIWLAFPRPRAAKALTMNPLIDQHSPGGLHDWLANAEQDSTTGRPSSADSRYNDN